MLVAQVVAFSRHFEMPRNITGPDEEDNSDSDHDCDTVLASGSPDTPNDSVCSRDVEGNQQVSATTSTAAAAAATASIANEKLADFQMAYIFSPPPAYLRDLTGRWYQFPWRLFRTYEV